jgi:capsular polysaccharide transport system permease protein
VERCEQALKEATVAMANYRNQQGVVDPHQQSDVNYQLISSLEAQLIDTKTQLANLKAFAPDSPQPATLELRAKTLQSAIDTETAKLAGNKNSLSTIDAVYQQLILDQKVKEQQLDLALGSLETARDQAERQQLYVEVISKPVHPDIAMEPGRFVGVLVTLIVGFVVWGIATMLIAGIREHQM